MEYQDDDREYVRPTRKSEPVPERPTEQSLDEVPPSMEMSTALAKFTRQETRPKQSQAGIGATLAYNGVVCNVLPPIVAELEARIEALEKLVASLQAKVAYAQPAETE